MDTINTTNRSTNQGQANMDTLATLRRMAIVRCHCYDGHTMATHQGADDEAMCRTCWHLVHGNTRPECEVLYHDAEAVKWQAADGRVFWSELGAEIVTLACDCGMLPAELPELIVRMCVG